MGMLRGLCPLWRAVLTFQLYACHAGSWLNLTEEMTEHYPFPETGRSLLLCQMPRCAADAACSWGGGHTSFTLQIMVPPHETVQRSIWKGNWGKFSWMSEAGESFGCEGSFGEPKAVPWCADALVYDVLKLVGPQRLEMVVKLQRMGISPVPCPRAPPPPEEEAFRPNQPESPQIHSCQLLVPPGAQVHTSGQWDRNSTGK